MWAVAAGLGDDDAGDEPEGGDGLRDAKGVDAGSDEGGAFAGFVVDGEVVWVLRV